MNKFQFDAFSLNNHIVLPMRKLTMIQLTMYCPLSFFVAKCQIRFVLLINGNKEIQLYNKHIEKDVEKMKNLYDVITK